MQRLTRVREAASRHGLLLIILVLGAVFRFADLGAMRFNYDDSYPMFEALRGLAGGGWSLLGQPSSVFLDNPPLMNFIHAIPLVVWRSPWAVSIFIVALNTFAIICVYCAGRQMLGQIAASIAATLFAINPWVVIFSRALWVQSLVPLLVTLIACSLWPTLLNGHRSGWSLLVAALSLTALCLTYIQAWGLLVSIGLLLLIFWSSIPRRPFWIGAGIFVVGVSVYGIGLLTDWDATQAQLSRFTSLGEWRITAEGIDHAVRFVTGLDFHAQYHQTDPVLNGLPLLSPIVYGVLSLALLCGIVMAVQAVWRKRDEWRAGVILLVWFFVPILFTTITAHPVHPHYLLLSAPAGYLLAAWGLLPLTRRLIGRLLILGILIGSTVVFGLNLSAYNADADLHPTTARWDGWTLAAGTQVGDAIRQLMDGKPTPWRVAVEARASIIGALSGQFVQNLNGLDYPNYVVLPGQDALLYLLFNEAIDPQAFGPHAEAMSGRTLEFVNGARATLVRVLPYDRSAALALPQVRIDWPSAAGLTLLGYTLSGPIAPGHSIGLTTYWRVDDLRRGREEWHIGAFYQLVDRVGHPIANAESHSQWARRWQEGDVYVERTQLELPADIVAGEYQLNVGLFDNVHNQTYEFQLSGGGQESFEIPLKVTAR